MADRDIVYRFGRFELDPQRRELRRDGLLVKIAHRHVRLLEVLLSHRNRIVSSEELFAAGWDTAVDDNSVKQAIAGLRKQLRDDPDAGSIKTFVGQGYQFIGAVTEIDREPASAAVVSAMVGSYHRLREAHEALATMSLDVVSDAKELIASALRAAPESVGGQIDMAMACILVYEASRIDVEPDVEALALGLRHAQAVCDRDPHAGPAWGALAYLQHLNGDHDAATVSARIAVERDPREWRNLLSLGFATHGAGRLEAMTRLKQVYPRYAGGHWLEGTVYIARQAFPLAIETLCVGCALHEGQRSEAGPFNPVGLRLMLGNVHAAEGRDAEALEQYHHELALVDPGHLYARECCANAWYSIGAIHWRNGRRPEAETAFREARVFVPAHPLAAIALSKLLGQLPPDPSCLAMRAVDAVLVPVVRLAVNGQHEQAAACAADLLADAAPGPDGWLLPAEPLIHATARPDAWGRALQILHDRAA